MELTTRENAIFASLLARYPVLASIEGELAAAYDLMRSRLINGGKLLIAGNGGSAADSEHIAGELMKRFILPRPVPAALTERLAEIDPVLGPELAGALEGTIPAMALTGHVALTTAYMNDVGAETAFSQQLYGFGRAGDVFLGITTSGNSGNILRAAVTAKALDIAVVCLTGQSGGKMNAYADVTVHAPATETFMIQEYHLPIYHCWCAMLEAYFFGSEEK